MDRFSLVLALVGVAASGLGCGAGDDGAFEGSTPTRDTVALQIPGGGGVTTTGALTDTGVRKSELLGEKADGYKVTVAISDLVNGSTAAVLALVHAVIAYPPTSVASETAVWGPYSEPLKANAWRLTVTKSPSTSSPAPGWQSPRPPTTALSWWCYPVCTPGPSTRSAISSADSAAGPSRSTGTRPPRCPITTTTSARRRSPTRGSIRPPPWPSTWPFTASRTKIAKGDLRRRLSLRGHAGRGRRPPVRGQPGRLPGPGRRDGQGDPDPSSRWQETGAGRSDVRVTGGDLATSPSSWPPPRNAGMWDSRRSYKLVSYDAAGSWGAESSCAFGSADFVTLAP